MRVLLDECVPRPLRRHLSEHEVQTVKEVGWSGTENGALLALIRAAGFDAFLTVDQNLQYQQDLRAAGVAVVVLVASSNRLDDLEPLVPRLREALKQIAPADLVRVGG